IITTVVFVPVEPVFCGYVDTGVVYFFTFQGVGKIVSECDVTYTQVVRFVEPVRIGYISEVGFPVTPLCRVYIQVIFPGGHSRTIDSPSEQSVNVSAVLPL